MAKCKNCSSQIEDNATVCPICGQINPIKTKKVKTTDMTMKFKQERISEDNYEQKSRKIVVLLFFVIGFTGIPFFYLKDLNRALLSILGSLTILGSALMLGLLISDILLWLLGGVIVLYLINIAIGVYYLTHHELKDGQGEFLV
ncbi:MAG: hypothetical protein AB7E23_02025 [Bacilli bacterium]|jgi:hypothetical protein